MKIKQLYQNFLGLIKRISMVLPTECIKKEEVPIRKKFDLLLETANLDNKISHLFVVEIHFDHKNATPKQLLCTKIFPPIIEKHKIIDTSADLSIN